MPCVLMPLCCCAFDLQVYDVLNADVIVMEKGALQTINDTYGAATASKDE